MLSAAVAAALSACGFALSTSLQHRAAGRAPDRSASTAALMSYLVRQPEWLFGISIGALAFSLHALALNLGAIALVQPIMICGIVFAVLIRAALERTTPTRTELVAVSLTAAGLALFLVMSDPATSETDPEHGTAATMVVLGWCAIAVIVVAQPGWSPRLRAAMLGVAAGVTFGLTAGLVKLITVDLAEGSVSGPTVLAVVALVASGVTGISINQHAYRLAALSTSMPVLNVVSVCVAVLFGALVFAEYPALDAAALISQVAALLLMGVGLRMVATGSGDEGYAAANAEHAEHEDLAGGGGESSSR